MPDILQLAFKLSINATDLVAMAFVTGAIYLLIVVANKLRDWRK